MLIYFMPLKFYKILLIFSIAVILTAMPVFWFAYSAPAELEVDFLDVGQGDAILIKTPYGQNILIDGGPDSKVLKELSANMDFWDKTIDLMILTHPHDDHVGGLVPVLQRYDVKRILYTGVVHSSPSYLVWLELIRDQHISTTIIDRPQKINFGQNCYLDILWPRTEILGQEVANLNNSSIVAKLIFNDIKFLFMGDAELEVEKALLNSKVDLSAQVLKAGHHGSDTSSNQNFLNAVDPEIVIIMSGEDNKFGHPSRRILKRLERLKAEIYRTDEFKTIKLRVIDNDIIKL